MSGTEYQGFEELLVALDELAVPDGCRAEITRGSIVVSPWSRGYYLLHVEEQVDGDTGAAVAGFKAP
ncbi:hypothetical protein ABZY14_35970 [Streptomyces sp. NPDC006617]|uniref:hypothetical protein n=1 Tax=Streptomyces sp. NPDC006617 TaxID=3155354 RepID=UPI0033A08C65